MPWLGPSGALGDKLLDRSVLTSQANLRLRLASGAWPDYLFSRLLTHIDALYSRPPIWSIVTVVESNQEHFMILHLGHFFCR